MTRQGRAYAILKKGRGLSEMAGFIFWSILLTQQKADWRKPHVDVSVPVKRMWYLTEGKTTIAST